MRTAQNFAPRTCDTSAARDTHSQYSSPRVAPLICASSSSGNNDTSRAPSRSSRASTTMRATSGQPKVPGNLPHAEIR
eukprot:15445779-Alexandrium_andersonii.AAC.1